MKAVLNAAAGEDPEDCLQRLGRMKWETGRAASGAEGRTAPNVERESSVVVGEQWTWLDRRLIFDLQGGSP